MRIIQKEKDIIVKEAKRIFGEKVQVYLFGSRTDDAKKGGDIDLYLIPVDKNDLFKKKLEFLSSVKYNIGDQKIDIVIAKDYNRLVEQEAIIKGVRLC